MKSGTVQTGTLKAWMEEGIQELSREAAMHREHGRIGEAESLERFCWAAVEYVRLIENTVRASRETIRALTITRAEKATNGNERNILV